MLNKCVPGIGGDSDVANAKTGAARPSKRYRKVVGGAPGARPPRPSTSSAARVFLGLFDVDKGLPAYEECSLLPPLDTEADAVGLSASPPVPTTVRGTPQSVFFF